MGTHSSLTRRSPHWWMVMAAALLCPAAAASDKTTPAVSPLTALYDNRVIELTMAERFLWHTNIIDWTALFPNIGVEFTLGDTNWHKWTLSAYGRYKPPTESGSRGYLGWTLTDGRVEVRRYHHGKGPRRVFYLGLYGGAAHYNMISRDGGAVYGGLTAGTVIPLYSYTNGGNIDFETGVSAGPVWTGGAWTTRKELLIGLNDILRVSIVYHLGTPTSDRYKKRAVVDEQYMLRLEAERHSADSIKREKERIKSAERDSLFESDYMKRLEKQRIELERQYMREEKGK